MLGERSAPAELAWIAVMDRVGGYASYASLMATDANEYRDVVLALEGEGEAHKIRRMREEQQRGKRRK